MPMDMSKYADVIATYVNSPSLYYHSFHCEQLDVFYGQMVANKIHYWLSHWNISMWTYINHEWQTSEQDVSMPTKCDLWSGVGCCFSNLSITPVKIYSFDFE